MSTKQLITRARPLSLSPRYKSKLFRRGSSTYQGNDLAKIPRHFEMPFFIFFPEWNHNLGPGLGWNRYKTPCCIEGKMNGCPNRALGNREHTKLVYEIATEEPCAAEDGGNMSRHSAPSRRAVGNDWSSCFRENRKVSKSTLDRIYISTLWRADNFQPASPTTTQP